MDGQKEIERFDDVLRLLMAIKIDGVLKSEPG